MKKRGKRGQISLFIIAGMILLLCASIILFINLRNAEVQSKIIVEKSKSPVYEEKELELVGYVHSCLEPISLKGLEILRLQGGYIELPEGVPYIEVVDKEDYRYVENLAGELNIKVDKKGREKNKVPYWITPPPESKVIVPMMEKELSNFINKELKKCIADFEPFQEEGFVITTGEIDTTVLFENQVIIDVDFPITVTRGEIVYTTEQFYYKIPVNMGLIKEMALNILMNEMGIMFLESTTMKSVSLYTGIDKNKLPPISAATSGFSCDEVTWELPQVKKNLQKLIDMNWYFLHINNTKFFRELSSDKASQAFFDSLIINIWGKDTPLLNVEFRYEQEWGMDLDILPKEGTTVTPMITKATMLILPLQCYVDYDFFYDIGFPTLTKIEDLESAKINENTNLYYLNQGFKFWFPMDVRICGNNYKSCVNVDWGDEEDKEDEDEKIDQKYKKTKFCESWNKKSEPITLNITELYSGNISDNVHIDYRCGNNFDRCYIGRTNDKGILTKKFPFCENGQLILEKKEQNMDYVDFSVPTKYPDNNIELKFEERVPINVTLKLVNVRDYIKQIYNDGNYNPENITKTITNYSALMTFSNDDDYNAFIFYPNDNTINISSGEYKINIIGTEVINVSEKVLLNAKSGGLQRYSLNSSGGDFYGEYVYFSKSKINLSVPYLHNKSEIILKGLVEYFPSNNLSADLVMDNVIKKNGSLIFEVWINFLKTGEEWMPKPEPIRTPWTCLIDPLGFYYELSQLEWYFPAICNTNITVKKKFSGVVIPDAWGDMDINCTKVHYVNIDEDDYKHWFETEVI